MEDLKKAIFYSDLDGTLLNNKAFLSSKSQHNLKQIINYGLLFGVASARNLNAISKMLNGIVTSLPVISLNGAYISDLKSMKHIQINAIDTLVVADTLDFIARNKLSTFISGHQNGLDLITHYKLHNSGELWYLDYCKADKNQNLVDLQNIHEVKSNITTCFTFIDRKENLAPIIAYFNATHPSHIEMHLFENQYSRGWYWLTVHSNLATKSNAIQFVQEQFNHQDKHLTVFGDGDNDLKMFHLADTAIAVNNANASVKAQANIIIPENTNDSVTNYLLDLITNKNTP